MNGCKQKKRRRRFSRIDHLQTKDSAQACSLFVLKARRNPDIFLLDQTKMLKVRQSERAAMTRGGRRKRVKVFSSRRRRSSSTHARPTTSPRPNARMMFVCLSAAGVAGLRCSDPSLGPPSSGPPSCCARGFAPDATQEEEATLKQK